MPAILLRIALVATLHLAGATVALGQTLIVGIAPSLPAPIPTYEEIPNPKATKFSAIKKQKTTIRVKSDSPVPTKNQAWQSVFDYLAQQTQYDFEFKPSRGQLDFELKLAKGYFDLAYLTPIEFITFNQHPGYQAIAKRKAQPIRGMIFVRDKGPVSTLKELANKPVAFPGLLDFPGSIAPRASLDRLELPVLPSFLANQQRVYDEVLSGKAIAGAGTRESFSNLSLKAQSRLRIIWDTPGYTPYAFAAHPRVPFFSIITIQQALVRMIKQENGKALLKDIFVDNGFEAASDKDWHDAELIDIKKLNEQH